MAGIGLYGVYYSKATMENGVVTGYNGVKTMGKAMAATFEPGSSDANNLYANNGIAETDATASAGGNLNITLDRLKAEAIADIFGMELETESVTVGGQQVQGSGFNYTGNEEANTVGVAFIRQAQEDNSRDHHQAVIFAACTFKMPSDEYATMGESIEWQTPEIEGTVTANSGSFPWRKVFDFPTQAAAEAFITKFFAAA